MTVSIARLFNVNRTDQEKKSEGFSNFENRTGLSIAEGKFIIHWIIVFPRL